MKDDDLMMLVVILLVDIVLLPKLLHHVLDLLLVFLFALQSPFLISTPHSSWSKGFFEVTCFFVSSSG